MKKPTGYVFYRGSSLIDGSPIVGVAVLGSGNTKTGDMVQTYIIRSDMSPLHASKTGADVSICGACPHRGEPTDDPKRKQAKNRACYVVLGQGPTIVWKGLERGIYPDIEPDELSRMLKGRKLRIGTYGDGAAIPADVWRTLISGADGWTAYSHQSGLMSADIYMHSADSLDDARQAWSKGRRTFRIITDPSQRVPEMESPCPAGATDNKINCVDCMLCNGANNRAKSITILAHGNGASFI